MARKGGYMGTTRKNPRSRQRTNNTGSEEAEQKTNPGAAESEDGFESLRVAADRQLGQNSDKIAAALGQKAADGDLNSAKFLVAVAGKKERKNTRKKRSGLSVAQKLALEPQWEEPPESNAEPDPRKPGDEGVKE
jgi:hypothetical protein